MFSISFCLYRACFTHLISSNLSCNLCLWYFDQLVHLNKEINANVYRHSLWEYSKHFHCSFEWHLTPHMTLSIETCIRRTPCIKRTLQHSPRVSAQYRFHCVKKKKSRNKGCFRRPANNVFLLEIKKDTMFNHVQ